MQNLETMTVFDMVTELRNMPNPTTGKPHHSLTEIAHIANAPNGWTYHVLRGPRSNNSRSEKYISPLRHYLKDLRATMIARTERDLAESNGSTESKPQRNFSSAAKTAMADAGRELRELRQDRGTPTPHGTGTVQVQGNRVIQTTGNGAHIVTKTPTPPPATRKPVAETATPKNFFEAFEALKARLWKDAEDVESLMEAAPPMFRGGIQKLRDNLMGVLQDMEG